MSRIEPRRIGLALLAPVVAVIVAFIITSLVLLAMGDPVMAVWKTMFQPPLPRHYVAILNSATVFYLSAVAVAIGFRMNLFNIGVDGQYRVASFAAAVFAGQAWLPGILNIIVALIVAMCAGGLWARDRRIPQGQARSVRGDLHDHAQRHRDCCGQLVALQGP